MIKTGIKNTSINDFQALHDLKMSARNKQHGSLRETARQFEALFLQNMLKSMRNANNFLEESSPFKSKQMNFFSNMLDKERSLNMAQRGGIGLADMMVQQLEKFMPNQKQQMPKITPAKATEILAKKDNSQANEAKLSPSGINLPLPNFNKLLNEFGNRKTLALTPSDFAKSILPYAEKAAAELGVDAKLLVAQAALETGWGQQIIKDDKGESSNNLFNIKAPNPEATDAIYKKTNEYINGEKVVLNEPFRKYNSYQDSFRDYVTLVKNNKRYQHAINASHNAQQYVAHLQQAGYASDPNYAKKVMDIYHGDVLKSVK